MCGAQIGSITNRQGMFNPGFHSLALLMSKIENVPWRLTQTAAQQWTRAVQKEDHTRHQEPLEVVFGMLNKDF